MDFSCYLKIFEDIPEDIFCQWAEELRAIIKASGVPDLKYRVAPGMAGFKYAGREVLMIYRRLGCYYGKKKPAVLKYRKTGRNYDTVVCAAFVALSLIGPDYVEVSSDGKIPDDWHPGISLYLKATGKNIHDLPSQFNPFPF